jgi:aspartate racemase
MQDSEPRLLIHELIASRAGEYPGRIAVRCGSDALDYQTLLDRSSQLAHYFRECGVMPGSLVVVCLNRSVDTVVSILATLLAGGAYVPVDPGYPMDRILSIIEDSKAGFAITQSQYLGILPAHGLQVICLDHEAESISRHPVQIPENYSSPDNLAYIIYTSGSTGKPKGVMIPHESLRNFVRISQTALDVFPEDVYLQSASVAYAVSVRQIMVPLACGAEIVVAREDQAKDPLLLFEEIRQRGVTLMDVVPSFWRSINTRMQSLSLTERRRLLDNKLRRIVSVGEALPYDIPRNWRALTGHPAELVNIFGQSETTGVVAAYPIPAVAEELMTATVPIGKSLSETRLYILDGQLRPVQAGVTGELCISNPCLARGYLHQPDLTAEKFIANPFHDGYSRRLYRTGDLARLLDNGNIVFLGRSDTQVKIRGQRLELGEVESVIRKFPGVRNCVVLALGDDPELKSLTAYIIPEEPSMDVAALRVHLRRELPDFMVPARYVFLDTLPLTPNGKVDRQVLSTISSTDEREQVRAIDSPRDQTEEKLLAILRELLPGRQIGINDDFFDIGGQSLMGVRLFARIEKEFGTRLPLTTLLQDATISRLGALLRKSDTPSYHEPVVIAINSHGNKPPMFGVHGVEGGVLFWRDIVCYLPPDQPFYAIQAQGVDGVTPALSSIEEMASLYIQEMQIIQPHGPYFLCGFSMGGEIAFEMSQQLLKMREQVRLLVLLDTRKPERLVPLSSSSFDDESSASNPTADRRQRIDLGLRWRWHVRRLSSLNVSGKAGYLWLLVKTPFLRAVVFRLASFFQTKRIRLPDPLLLLYLRTIHSKALHAYIPKRYPGKVTLFRSSETEQINPDDESWGWNALAGGGLDMFRFNASHNIVDSQYAEEVARTLNDCLVKARGGDNLPVFPPG